MRVTEVGNSRNHYTIKGFEILPLTLSHRATKNQNLDTSSIELLFDGVGDWGWSQTSPEFVVIDFLTADGQTSWCKQKVHKWHIFLGPPIKVRFALGLFTSSRFFFMISMI